MLVLDLEQGVRSVKKMLREAGLEACDEIDYALIPEGLALERSGEQADALEHLLTANAYAVVVLDPYYKAHTGDSNDERQVDDLMRLLDLWRTRHRFALILPAHCRKPAANAPAAFTIHDIFGSSAFLRGAEIVLGLRRVSDGYSRLHFFKDRDGDLPTGTSWGLLFDREIGYRRDPNDGVTRDIPAELLALLADRKWRTLDEIRGKRDKGGIGADRETVRPILEALTLEGVLEYCVGPAGRHPTAHCWKVADTRNATSATSPSSALHGDTVGGGSRLSPPYIGESQASHLPATA